VRDDVVHFNDEIRFPVRSMVGVVGVATEGEEITNAMPREEVRERVTRRVLLHLAERTTGEVSDAMRSVARECGKRGIEG
jgi:acetamidase/formamidase